MKKIITSMLSIVAIMAMFYLNIGFSVNAKLSKNISLSELAGVNSASAEDPPDGYITSYSGSVTTDGIPCIWSGDCKAHYVWVTSSGWCRRW